VNAADEPSLKPNEEPPQEAPAQTADEPHSQPPAQAPKAQEAPVFDLAGTESESNAEVLGGRVIPASPDDRFRNRPPIYPREAAVRGEHGAVVILIHVSETGVAAGVDVMETSGVASLDKAAVDAVLKWHFRPALKEGRAVPFAMRFRFIFEEY
jgi:protein TonB